MADSIMLNISLGDAEKRMNSEVTILANDTKLFILVESWLYRILGKPYKYEWLVIYTELHLQFQ